MDKINYAVVGLRGLALTLALSGQSKASEQMYTLADLVEAGRATDEHMKRVADLLKERDPTKLDFDDAIARINADSDRLQGD